jgi:hypothetical protein
MCTFSLAVSLGCYGRLSGRSLRVIDPSHLFAKWLTFSEWEFKKNFIDYAGRSFQYNSRLIDRKWFFGVAVMLLFSFEVLWVLLWVLCRP